MQRLQLQGHRQRLTRAEAAKRLGVSKSTVRNLERRGELCPLIDARGVRYFDVGRVDALAERLSGESFAGLDHEQTKRAKALCLAAGTTLRAWVREKIEAELLAG